MGGMSRNKKQPEPEAPSSWEPGPLMERFLSEGVATDQDFRDLSVALMMEVASGRLHVVKVNAITNILALMKDTLVGPQQNNVNVLLQQLVAAEAAVPVGQLEAHDAPIGDVIDLTAMHKRQVATATGREETVGDDEDEWGFGG